MVEYIVNFDNVFSSLADPTRRDILRRVMQTELSVTEIAEPYNLTLAAISKHLKILEKANLISKHRRGKQQFVQADPATLKDAAKYLERYQELWNERYDTLEKILQEDASPNTREKN